MATRFRPSTLLWGLFFTLGVVTLLLRLANPGHRALPWLAAVLLGLLALRVGAMSLEWRRGRLPGTRLLVPAVLLAEGLGLTMGGATRLAFAVKLATAATLELLLLALAIRALRQARSLPAEWPEERIATAISAFVPPRAARLMALELVMLGSAFRFLAGGFREPTPSGFSLHRETFLRAFLPVLPLLIPTDLFLIHTLFPHMAPCLRWSLHLSTVYAVLWMTGLYATLRQRPHQVDGVTVDLHMGILCSLRLRKTQICSAGPLPEFDDDWARREHLKGVHRLLRTGAPAVELCLTEAVPMMGLLGPSPHPRDRVAVSVDDPAAFLAALAIPCA
jgi:hypothetical protein